MTSMSIKDSVNKLVNNTKDAVHETQHRSAAEGEHAKREVAGDDLTLGQKANSVVKETTNDVQAEADKAKRESR